MAGAGRPAHWNRAVSDETAGRSDSNKQAPIAASWPQVVKTAVLDWQEDKATRLAAALSYYTLFSIAPLLLVVVAVAGFAFGEEAVTGRLDEELNGFLGPDGADVVQEMVERARKPGAGIVASVVGIALLLWGASGVFSELKDALNTIWEVGPQPDKGWLGTIKDRLLSFAMVLCIGFLLLVSLVISTALSAAEKLMGDLIRGPDAVVHVLNAVVSLGVITVLFALIFKYLPDVHVGWRHVWLGAFVTALLFTIGKFLFGLYLGHGTIGSSYGAAGSVVVILLWAYYSSMILLLGAEFTQAHSRAFGGMKTKKSGTGVSPVTSAAAD